MTRICPFSTKHVLLHEAFLSFSLYRCGFCQALCFRFDRDPVIPFQSHENQTWRENDLSETTWLERGTAKGKIKECLLLKSTFKPSVRAWFPFGQPQSYATLTHPLRPRPQATSLTLGGAHVKTWALFSGNS